MSKQTIEIDVPEGYELTGEFRAVRGGEWFLADSGAPLKANNSVSGTGFGHRLILRLLQPNLYVPVPDGYELTGEFRQAMSREHFLGLPGEAHRATGKTGWAYPILRKID